MILPTDFPLPGSAFAETPHGVVGRVLRACGSAEEPAAVFGSDLDGEAATAEISRGGGGPRIVASRLVPWLREVFAALGIVGLRQATIRFRQLRPDLREPDLAEAARLAARVRAALLEAAAEAGVLGRGDVHGAFVLCDGLSEVDVRNAGGTTLRRAAVPPGLALWRALGGWTDGVFAVDARCGIPISAHARLAVRRDAASVAPGAAA